MTPEAYATTAANVTEAANKELLAQGHRSPPHSPAAALVTTAADFAATATKNHCFADKASSAAATTAATDRSRDLMQLTSRRRPSFTIKHNKRPLFGCPSLQAYITSAGWRFKR